MFRTLFKSIEECEKFEAAIAANPEVQELYNTMLEDLKNAGENKILAQTILVEFFQNETVTNFMLSHFKELNECQLSLLKAFEIELEMHELSLFDLDVQIKRLEQLNLEDDKSVIALKKLREEIKNNLNNPTGWTKDYADLSFDFINDEFSNGDGDISYTRTVKEVINSPDAQFARETAAMLKTMQFTLESKKDDKEIIKKYYKKQLNNQHVVSHFFKAITAVVTSLLSSIVGVVSGVGVGVGTLDPATGIVSMFKYGYMGANIGCDFAMKNLKLRSTDSLGDFLLFKPRREVAAAIKFGKQAKKIFPA